MGQDLQANQRYPLPKILLADLFSANKTLMCLLFLIVFSALGTIWITHQTRILVAEKSELITQKQMLDNEYLSLRLEEATLSDNVRIQVIARQMGLKVATLEQEVEILE